MAAKGTQSKIEIINKMLEVFPGSFVTAEGKELRIPWNEGGAQLEIKVALTCAKEVLGGTVTAPSHSEPSAFDNPQPAKIEVTQEEAENVRKLLSSLNL